MEAHEDLLIWAEDNGVTLNGIRPQRLPGRGFGIVATKSHEVGFIESASHPAEADWCITGQ